MYIVGSLKAVSFKQTYRPTQYSGIFSFKLGLYLNHADAKVSLLTTKLTDLISFETSGATTFLIDLIDFFVALGNISH